MLKPSLLKSSALAAAASLFLSTGAFAEEPKPEDKPVPPVPANVLKEGGDAVLQWMFENDFVSPEFLRQFVREKARAAATEETADENPLLAKLHSNFNALPTAAFKVGVKPAWEKVAAKLTPDVLAKVNLLENPKIYGVNREGQLLIGDGGSEVPSSTLGQNYPTARNAAKAQGLSLMTLAEYHEFNNGTMEVWQTYTWLELALLGRWHDGSLDVSRADPLSAGFLGARRVLRVKIN